MPGRPGFAAGREPLDGAQKRPTHTFDGAKNSKDGEIRQIRGVASHELRFLRPYRLQPEVDLVVEGLANVRLQLVLLLQPLADEVHRGCADVDDEGSLPAREKALPVSGLVEPLEGRQGL